MSRTSLKCRVAVTVGGAALIALTAACGDNTEAPPTSTTTTTTTTPSSSAPVSPTEKEHQPDWRQPLLTTGESNTSPQHPWRPTSRHQWHSMTTPTADD